MGSDPPVRSRSPVTCVFLFRSSPCVILQLPSLSLSSITFQLLPHQVNTSTEAQQHHQSLPCNLSEPLNNLQDVYQKEKEWWRVSGLAKWFGRWRGGRVSTFWPLLHLFPSKHASPGPQLRSAESQLLLWAAKQQLRASEPQSLKATSMHPQSAPQSAPQRDCVALGPSPVLITDKANIRG